MPMLSRTSAAWKQVRRTFREAVRRLQELRFTPGRRLKGRYRIVRRLGMGSYGVAYLCMDDTCGKPCVLKRVFPLHGGRARTEKIYRRETEILERLDHPSIPKLLDRFRYRGQPCLVMEYVDGGTLDELLFRDRRLFTEEESLRLFHSLLRIVEYLHGTRIVHRDISIGNVMLQEDRVYLIDFGLAVGLDDKDPAISSLAGDTDRDDPMEKKLSRAVDVSSDFYAMGHLLLFLLYSTYGSHGTAAGHEENPGSETEPGWENELALHEETRMLLRRLLQADEPYREVREVLSAVKSILDRLCVREVNGRAANRLR